MCQAHHGGSRKTVRFSVNLHGGSGDTTDPTEQQPKRAPASGLYPAGTEFVYQQSHLPFNLLRQDLLGPDVSFKVIIFASASSQSLVIGSRIQRLSKTKGLFAEWVMGVKSCG